MKVVINQSNYLPWKGYFDLIHDADTFIFLDDVQFTKNHWRNRNRILGPNGIHWLTIPVGPSLNRRIRDVTLPKGPWRRKHWQALQLAYGATQYFERYAPFFSSVYADGALLTLSELNQLLITTIARDFLGLKTRFCTSAEFEARGQKQERVLALLTAAGATTYISGPAGKSYLKEDSFRDRRIELRWKDYAGYPVYPQGGDSMVHEVSVVDLLFRHGPDAAEYIWGWRAAPVPTAP